MGRFKPRAGLTNAEVLKLSNTWHRIRNTGVMVEFDTFDYFCEWAVKNGYKDGKRLVRLSLTGPYSEDNCVWADPKRTTEETDEERAARWDAFVIPIRERFKDELERIEAEKAERQKITLWQYEHPDRVREEERGKDGKKSAART